MSRPDVVAFFDEATYTVSYLVTDPETGRAAAIDPVLDFDSASGRTSTRSADVLLTYLSDHRLTLDWLLETHVHADHLSGAHYLQQETGARTAIGKHVADVQATFKPIFNLGDLATDGSQFDRLFVDGDEFEIGKLTGRVIATPGHTPACLTYVVGDAAFVGDTLFMPDFGTARTDFPGGDAGSLYDSIQRILSLPDETRLFMCHDYKAPGRNEYAWETTVAEQREHNVHIGNGVDRAAFVERRETRDRELGMPKLILPSIQINVRGGAMPPAEDNNIRYLKLPIDAL